MTWRQVWSRQLRWGRTIRLCKPTSYFINIISNSTLWAVIAWIMAPQTNAPLLLVAILLRMVSAGHLQQKLCASSWHWKNVWLAPLYDLIQFVLWGLSLFGNRVYWRGDWFLAQKDGSLKRIA
jgi:ceramide glucosyltransferase